VRKIVLNFVKQYQASLSTYVAMSRILHRNMLDIDNLSLFLAHFRIFTKAD